MISDRARRYGGSLNWRQPQERPATAAPAASATPAAQRPASSVSSVSSVRGPAPAASSAAAFLASVARKHAGAGDEPPPLRYTDEQRAIIEDNSPIIVGKAFAGTGKTTTAVGFAQARPRSKLLYLPFNKTMQMQAAARFPTNTTCQTQNSVAFQAVGKHYGERVVKQWRAMTVRQEANLPNVRMAAMVQSVLRRFFYSADADIRPEHASELDVQFHARESEMNAALANAKALWRRMQDRSDKVSLPHDAYLKMWALGSPQLPYDYIICDEWQDANPLMADVIKKQRNAKLLVIGDPHQSIYAFRGAVNAMDDFAGARQFHLSQTWRFGPQIAAVANLILGELKGEKIKIQGMAPEGRYQAGAAVTKLARTNAQLFKDATLVHGQGVHWVGGIEKYQIEKILDAYYLWSKRRDRIREPFLRNFASFGELADYAEDAKDPEARILARVVEEYQHDTPDLVTEVRTNAVPEERDASLILSTGHNAKGLDFDFVQIADDFEILAETEAALAEDPFAAIEQQELNLLYVVATRAKKALQLNAETKTWLADLPRHRRARTEAITRSRVRLATRGLRTP